MELPGLSSLHTHFSCKSSPTHVDSSETLGSRPEFKIVKCKFECCLSTRHELLMTDLPKSAWGGSERGKSIEACNWSVACGEELHQVLSNRNIQREAADWGAAREVCEVLAECCRALLIRQTHASPGHLPRLYTHAGEQRQINYCDVGKHQDKMTWPRFDSPLPPQTRTVLFLLI